MKQRIISSKLQITMIMMVFIIPLIIFLVIYNVYTMDILNKRIAQTGQETISVYQGALEKGLRDAEALMVHIVANDTDFKQLSYATDDLDVILCSQDLIKKIQTMIATTSFTSFFYIYNSNDSNFWGAYNTVIPCRDKIDIQNQLVELLNTQRNLSGEGWFIRKMGNKNYLLRVFQKNNVSLVSVTDLSSIEKPKFEKDSLDSLLFYADAQRRILTDEKLIQEKEIKLLPHADKPYYITGGDKKFLAVENELTYAKLNFIYVVPYMGFLSRFDAMQLVLFVSSIVIFILMFLSFRLLKIWYFDPLQKLIQTMEKIKSGELNAQMPVNRNILEFNVFAETFNEMITQIKLLKISAYEYKLEKQQARLQYLQIQIRPHFFLNCLKNIYALAEQKKYVQIQDMILAMSSHLRFMFKDNFVLIPLSKEIESVKNYILLQQMSTSYQIFCDIDMDSHLQEFPIPPLSIQTFVENSLKHAGVPKQHFTIYIKVSIIDGDNEKMVNVRILDNGVGFSEENLNSLNATSEFNYQGEHIGIQNIKHRCSLIYHNQCTFLFSNTTGGACVEFFIPMNSSEENISRKGEENL